MELQERDFSSHNFANLSYRKIDYAFDKSRLKQDRFTKLELI